MRGYTLVEMLVYLVVLAAILGICYVALNRLWMVSGHLRREADDLRTLLAAGERWREDVRQAAGRIENEVSATNQVITLRPAAGKEVAWVFQDGVILRRVGATNEWAPQVGWIRESAFREDVRGAVKAWRWDLELQPISKKARLRRQFTFLAVSQPVTP